MDLFQIDPADLNTINNMTEEQLTTHVNNIETFEANSDSEQQVFASYLLYTRSHAMGYLLIAIARAQSWLAQTENDHSDRSRRVQILALFESEITEDIEIPEQLLQIHIQTR